MSERRLLLYPTWENWDSRQYSHYVVSGHDNYYDILAENFTEEIVPKHVAGDLLKLIDEA